MSEEVPHAAPMDPTNGMDPATLHALGVQQQVHQQQVHQQQVHQQQVHQQPTADGQLPPPPGPAPGAFQGQQQAQQQQQQAFPNAEPEVVRNLIINYIPTTIDEMQMRQLFEMYGPIETVKIVSDRETRQSKGYGFVKYRFSASAMYAIQYLNGYPLMNKRLKVAYAKASEAQAMLQQGGMQQQMAMQQQAQAQQQAMMAPGMAPGQPPK